MNTPLKAGIVGGAGYTGGEMIRLLLLHPAAELQLVHSKSQAGQPLAAVHKDLLGYTDLCFTDSLQGDLDVLFLCVGHGEAKPFLEETPLPESVKVIDLSQDFRLNRASHSFTYGLPEFQRERIRAAQHIANPGCFATCLQLALLPLAHAGLIQDEVHISAITGSTGAGQKLTRTSHFSWRNNNLSVYKAFQHQHLGEVGETLTALQPALEKAINFIPYRGDFTRGIIASCYTHFRGTAEEAQKLYHDYYQGHPFTHICQDDPDLKMVVNTNMAYLYLQKADDKLLIISMIDNLLKGAAGQAVQNMNLLFGLEEKSGLLLKPSAF